MKKNVEVTLLNQKLTLKTDANEEHVRQVAAFVNGRVEEVIGKAKTVSTLTASLLVCLNIADEFLSYKSGQSFKEEQMVQKLKNLLEKIEADSSGPGMIDKVL